MSEEERQDSRRKYKNRTEPGGKLSFRSKHSATKQTPKTLRAAMPGPANILIQVKKQLARHQLQQKHQRLSSENENVKNNPTRRVISLPLSQNKKN